ncbi:kinase-like domain-containing protein [Blakeslea trispora]|nr:kinase-like domain-containing protein [Blakeslea trispora]
MLESKKPIDCYEFVEKIADGNFSSVYKAQDLLKEVCNNDEWESLLTVDEIEDMKGYVAIKHIHSRSSPARVADEIACLLLLKNSPGIAPLIGAFRDEEGTFLVMPYIKNEEFGRQFVEAEMQDIRNYLKSLFAALQQTHGKKIIHRDVKPDNFLYNFSRKRGYLVDFGLAEVDDDSIETPAMVEPVASSSKRMPGCIVDDPRQPIRANRAGTPGFRAPEVVMRVAKQTCAIDIWSVGVILLSFLTGRYPFFLANDDADCLVELGQIFGYKELEACAIRNSKTISTNVIMPNSRIPWTILCQVLNKEKVGKWKKEEFEDAISLLDRCLDLDSTTRITAEEALSHPFLMDL